MPRPYMLLLSLFSILSLSVRAQECAITGITATSLPCVGFQFDVQIDLTVENPTSDSFTLAGNGIIYGSWPYSDLPVTIGSFLGDDESTYSFVAWDKQDAACQAFATVPAANCGPICGFSNASLTLVTCVSNALALVEFDVEHVNMPGAAFNLFYENGSQVGSYLYSSLPITIPFFEVNGAAPITLTVCDQTNADCCATFTLDAIDCNPNNCELFSAVVDPECTGNNFLVHLDFDFDNPPSDSFTVNGNGLDYGTFAYTDLPITLGPLNGGSGIEWEFAVADAANPECQLVEVLGPYTCPPPCDVLGLMADALLCNGDEAYSLEIGVDIEGEGDHGFSVLSPTFYYGTYAYDDLPITLPAYEGSGEFYDLVTVCDNDVPGCCATVAYEALLCAGCLIYNLEAVPQPCNAEDEIFVELDFDYNNVSTEGFEVTGNGNNYGTYQYEDLPVLIGPFPGDGSEYIEFVITDLGDPFCFNSIEIGFLECNEICDLTELVAAPIECTGNGTFAVSVDFAYQGVSGIGFDLWANGEFFGSFEYADLPLTILEFPSNGTALDTITVCDNDNPNCCATVVFEGLNCACEIIELAYAPLECVTDSTFAIALEIYAENAPSDFVDIYFDGVFLGFFNYEALPVIVNNVPEGDGEGLLTVCINDLPTCCAEILVTQMLCEGPVCHITDLLAEAGDCNSDSTYLLDVVFDHLNLPTDSVVITANGVGIGTYAVQPDFIRIEHFPALESDTVTLTVCAQGAPDCCDSYTYVAPDCSTFNQCEITNVSVDLGDCVTDSTYRLDIFFDYANLPGDFVVVTGNGEEIGTRLVSGGHIIFEAFPELPGTVVELTICALGDPSCCATITFEEPACLGQEFCHVWNLVAETGDCLTDSTFVLFFDFDTENLPGDEVVVLAGGEPLDTIIANGGPYVIEHFPDAGTANLVISVCAVGGTGCCDEYLFPSPDCDGSEQCQISELVADPGDCTSDSTYTLFIAYQTANFPGDSIIVTVNGEPLGVFLNQPDGFIIEDVPAFPNHLTELLVCAADAPDCCATIAYETLECGQGIPCLLVDLVADPGDCTSDSTYNLFIHYEASHLPGDSVSVAVNGLALGHFVHDPDGFTIENVPAATTTNSVVTVCAVGAPDCCDVFEYATPNCGQGLPCQVFDLVAEAGDCTSDSTFNLFLQYQSVNFPGDSISVTLNGEFLGHFPHVTGPWMIANVPASTSTNSVLTVCAVDAPDCCDTFEFATPDCGQGLPCLLVDLIAEVGACTSDTTFLVDLVFETANTPVDSILVYANGNLVGQYAISPTFNRIEDFPLLPGESTTITVCAVGAPECCDSYVIENPDCGGGACEIFDIAVNALDCTSDSTFAAIVSFEWANVDAGGFDLYAGDVYIGFFNFDQLPAEIPNFPANETGVYAVTVCESDNTECCSSHAFEGPVCGESPCSIANLTYTMTECNEDGLFAFILNFDFSDPGSQGFSVLGNGNNYGSFSYDNVPVELGPFAADGTAYEFVVRDNQYPDCQAVVVPGVVECTTSANQPPAGAIFEVYNNGTAPWIAALQDIRVSLYRTDGMTLALRQEVGASGQFNLNTYPDGLYIAIVHYGDWQWPVRLVRISR